jgi:hypothetical protein
MATKLNLRKAAATQTILQDLLKSINVANSIELNEFQDPATAINEANGKLFANDTRRNDVLMSIYSIRSLVGLQNAISGVGSKLTQIAYIDKRISQLEQLIADVTPMLDMDVIQGKLEKIRTRVNDNSRASIYGLNDEVRTSVLSTDQIENIRGVIRDLRKQKSALNDEILELNIKSEIELTPDVEAVLTREGLI